MMIILLILLLLLIIMIIMIIMIIIVMIIPRTESCAWQPPEDFKIESCNVV